MWGKVAKTGKKGSEECKTQRCWLGAGVKEQVDLRWMRWREKKVKKERSQVRCKNVNKIREQSGWRGGREMVVLSRMSTLADISTHMYRSSVRGKASVI